MEHRSKCMDHTERVQRPKYDFSNHTETFDPWKHGYIMKKGCLWYRRPDGVDVRAFAGVNQLDEYGELIPLCQLI